MPSRRCGCCGAAPRCWTAGEGGQGAGGGLAASWRSRARRRGLELPLAVGPGRGDSAVHLSRCCRVADLLDLAWGAAVAALDLMELLLWRRSSQGTGLDGLPLLLLLSLDLVCCRCCCTLVRAGSELKLGCWLRSLPEREAAAVEEAHGKEQQPGLDLGAGLGSAWRWARARRKGGLDLRTRAAAGYGRCSLLFPGCCAVVACW